MLKWCFQLLQGQTCSGRLRISREPLSPLHRANHHILYIQMHLLWDGELFFNIILQEVVGLLLKLVTILTVLNWKQFTEDCNPFVKICHRLTWEFLLITPLQSLTKITWVVLIPLNIITLLERFGCGVLSAIFGFQLHICLENPIQQLMKLLEFFMITQNRS